MYSVLMHYIELRESLAKFFSVDDIQKILKINKPSAKVLSSRYIRQGLFLRITQNLYVWKTDLSGLSTYEKCQIAGKIKVNSYVSFYGALYYHNVYRFKPDAIQSVNFIKSYERKIENTQWNHFKFPKKYYFGFEKTSAGFLVAEPEKAIVDIIYLNSIGRHFDSMKMINIEHLSQEKMLKYIEIFPKRAQKLMKIFLKYTRKKGHVWLKDSDYDENDC